MSDAKATTSAGGAKYHSLKPTAAWVAFRAAMDVRATRSVAERERQQRERQRGEVHNKFPNG